MRKGRLFIVAAFSACMCAPQAQVAYSSFEPEYGYDENTGYFITGASAPPKFIQTIAVGFESLASGPVDTISVAVGFLNLGKGRDLRLTLYDDDGTFQGFGGQLGAWEFENPANNSFGEVVHVQNTDAVSVTEGSYYWMYMEPLQDDGFHTWMYGDINILAPMLISHDGGKSFTYSPVNNAPALEVTVVPEPAAIAFVALSVAYLSARRRR